MAVRYVICILALFGSPLLGDRFRMVHQSIEEDLGSSPPYKLGSNITLKCKASDTLEYCKWSHKSRGFCLFEWTTLNGNVETKQCSSALNKRVKFIGDDQNCFIRLHDISSNDRGDWKCELQSYVLGPLDPLLSTTVAGTVELRIHIPDRKGIYLIIHIVESFIHYNQKISKPMNQYKIILI